MRQLIILASMVALVIAQDFNSQEEEDLYKVKLKIGIFNRLTAATAKGKSPPPDDVAHLQERVTIFKRLLQAASGGATARSDDVADINGKIGLFTRVVKRYENSGGRGGPVLDQVKDEIALFARVNKAAIAGGGISLPDVVEWNIVIGSFDLLSKGDPFLLRSLKPRTAFFEQLVARLEGRSSTQSVGESVTVSSTPGQGGYNPTEFNSQEEEDLYKVKLKIGIFNRLTAAAAKNGIPPPDDAAQLQERITIFRRLLQAASGRAPARDDDVADIKGKIGLFTRVFQRYENSGGRGGPELDYVKQQIALFTRMLKAAIAGGGIDLADVVEWNLTITTFDRLSKGDRFLLDILRPRIAFFEQLVDRLERGSSSQVGGDSVTVSTAPDYGGYTPDNGGYIPLSIDSYVPPSPPPPKSYNTQPTRQFGGYHGSRGGSYSNGRVTYTAPVRAKLVNSFDFSDSTNTGYSRYSGNPVRGYFGSSGYTYGFGRG